MTAELFFEVWNRWDGLSAKLNIDQTHWKKNAHPSFPDSERGHAPFISYGSL